VDEDGGFKNFITATRVLQLLSTVLHAVPEAKRSLSTLKLKGLAVKDVENVSMHDEVVKAFQKMKDNHISGVVVLDDLQHAIGNISLIDIKLLNFDMNISQC